MPSDEIVDEELRAKVIEYEKKIVRHEATGEDVEDMRAKLQAFLEFEYKQDSSRWACAPESAVEAGQAHKEVKENQSPARALSAGR